MKKRNLLAIGGLALCLSLVACTPDGEIDFDKAHEVVDVMEEELNKIDKDEVKQNIVHGLNGVTDVLEDITEIVEDMGEEENKVTPTVTPEASDNSDESGEVEEETDKE